MQRLDLQRIFGVVRPIIGMVHLQPLPGAPRHDSMHQVIDRACSDARALVAGGVDGIMIENYGDAPFWPERVPAETIAGITRAVVEVRRLTSLPVGVNVLRNDARAAIGIAAAVGAAFVRVNVHTGAMLTDQGWLQGRAHETVRARAGLTPGTAIFADVLVKHAVAPAGLDIATAARDTWERGGADALIISGAATGSVADVSRLDAARVAVPSAPLLIGSGLTADGIELLRHADGAIVGSALQQDGRAGAPVDTARVHRLMDAVRQLRA